MSEFCIQEYYYSGRTERKARKQTVVMQTIWKAGWKNENQRNYRGSIFIAELRRQGYRVVKAKNSVRWHSSLERS